MTGPLLRVTCDACGKDFARRRDGSPFPHRCSDGKPIPAMVGRKRCKDCGRFVTRGELHTCRARAASWHG